MPQSRSFVAALFASLVAAVVAALVTAFVPALVDSKWPAFVVTFWTAQQPAYEATHVMANGGADVSAVIPPYALSLVTAFIATKHSTI